MAIVQGHCVVWADNACPSVGGRCSHIYWDGVESVYPLEDRMPSDCVTVSLLHAQESICHRTGLRELGDLDRHSEKNIKSRKIVKPWDS